MTNKEHYLLFRITAFIRERRLLEDAYIVGGAVRDILMGKALHDIDIVLKGDCYSLAKEFANIIDAVSVTLDEDFSIIRVIKDDLWMDISRLRCDSIFIDLSERDFTINAMAIPLSGLDTPQRSLIDIYGGLEDLSEGYIRMVAEENFIKDPLRLIRALRFAVCLDFAIEGRTLKAIKDYAPLISHVAYERIAEELKKILTTEHSSIAIKLLYQTRLLTHIFSQSFSECLYFIKLERLLNNIERYLPQHGEAFKRYLTIDLRLVILKFVAIFDVKEEAINGAIRLKMSKKEIELIKTFVNHIKRLRDFYRDQITPTDDEVISFLLDVGDDLYGILLLEYANDIDDLNDFREYALNIVSFYEGNFKMRQKDLPLITGNDLISHLRIQSSPLFKKILHAVNIAFLSGKIVDKEGALKEASRIYQSLIK